MEKRKFRQISTVLMLSLGLAACAKGAPTESAPTPTPIKPDLRVTHKYTPSGKRITSIEDTLDRRPQIADLVVGRTIISYCDGQDLIDIDAGTAYYNPDDIYERTLNHPACSDGKLTPEDFTVPK